ncbi:unnamed protein product [Urochloa humidicola]
MGEMYHKWHGSRGDAAHPAGAGEAPAVDAAAAAAPPAGAGAAPAVDAVAAASVEAGGITPCARMTSPRSSPALPSSCVFRCRAVCRRWRRVAADRSFLAARR